MTTDPSVSTTGSLTRERRAAESYALGIFHTRRRNQLGGVERLLAEIFPSQRRGLAGGELEVYLQRVAVVDGRESSSIAPLDHEERIVGVESLPGPHLEAPVIRVADTATDRGPGPGFGPSATLLDLEVVFDCRH